MARPDLLARIPQLRARLARLVLKATPAPLLARLVRLARLAHQAP